MGEKRIASERFDIRQDGKSFTSVIFYILNQKLERAIFKKIVLFLSRLSYLSQNYIKY